MSKPLLSLASALLLSCSAQHKAEEPTPVVEIVEDPVTLTSAPRHLLGPFSYQIVTNSGFLGVEFVADGRVWTVRHLMESPTRGSDKCVDLGPHPYRKGFTISTEPLFVHQKLWFMSTHGPVKLVVMNIKKDAIYVAVAEGVIVPGDSGSAVLNMDGEVVGCISATYPTHPFFKDYKYGILGRF